MIDKKELREWLIKNCYMVDENGDETIDLSGLNLRGYYVNLSNIKAKAIDNEEQIADKYINNTYQQSKIIDNHSQRERGKK